MKCLYFLLISEGPEVEYSIGSYSSKLLSRSEAAVG